ncbi:MAG TPA: single-stranded-DNA-specific exonuclease RecJ [Thermoleophilaceae bacterium]
MLADAARWSAAPYSFASADAIAAELGLSRTVASVLVRRGHHTPAEARRFLEGSERHDPFLLGQMRSACDKILAHVARGSPIVVHGDYDVDGVASTAVLVRALRRLGARVSWHLPSRMDDGYGLSLRTVERLASEGAGLLVTVDCAITAAAEVDLARALGLEVVVTDHHRPGERLPDCPIVHPALGGYPFPDLCAAGVAHKLAEALYVSAGEDPAPAAEDIDIVALATVADLVPLRGENRRLVREGLEAMARTRKAGLRALMKIAALDPGEVDARALAFRLAPRINAAGRLQRADAGLELLLTEDEARAAQVADELDLLNRERQDTETRIMFAAEAERARHDGQPAYVLAGEGWHPGVIGIVASRIVERHHRPTLMISLDGEAGRGSGRSIGAYDLHAGLAACSEHLTRFGGHRAAAGFEVPTDGVDALRRAFVRHAAASLTPYDLIPEERVDALVPGTALGLGLAEELRRLEPFGMGNPEPTLLVPAARVGDARSMGDEGQHCRFTLSSGGIRARGVAFRTAVSGIAACGEEPRDVALRLELNRWNGTIEPRVVLRALCRIDHGECEVLEERGEFWAALDAGAEPWSALEPGPASREVCDRRGEGFAGVAGDLVSSGEPVLVVCADVARRRDVLAQVLGARVAPLVSWDGLAARPEIGTKFAHVVALDPPPHVAGEALLAALPGGGFAHLAWGEPEVAFALALAQAELDLRPPLTAIYRALRESGGAEGEQLRALLCGHGRYPRSPVLCRRLLAVLVELGLATYADRSCTLLEGVRADLETASTYRRCQQQLREARAYLSAAMPARRSMVAA